jgi:hypothetical protein
VNDKKIDFDKLNEALSIAYNTAMKDNRTDFACGILLAKDIARNQLRSKTETRDCASCTYYNTDQKDQPCCGCVGGCNYEESEVEGE